MSGITRFALDSSRLTVVFIVLTVFLGVSLFLDSVLRGVTRPTPSKRIFLPSDTPEQDAARLREEGWRTVAALGATKDHKAEAWRLGCSHYFMSGAEIALDEI